MFEIFKNGSRKVNRRLMVFELACGVYIAVAAYALGNIASQHWIREIFKEFICFWIGLSIVFIKGVEMFFNKAAALYRYSVNESASHAGKTLVTQTDVQQTVTETPVKEESKT